MLRLFRSQVFVIFLLAVSIAQASHALLYGFGSLHWEQLGHSKAMIGILWGIGVVGRGGFFFFSGRLVPRFSPMILILIGCLAAFCAGRSRPSTRHCGCSCRCRCCMP